MKPVLIHIKQVVQEIDAARCEGKEEKCLGRFPEQRRHEQVARENQRRVHEQILRRLFGTYGLEQRIWHGNPRSLHRLKSPKSLWDNSVQSKSSGSQARFRAAKRSNVSSPR